MNSAHPNLNKLLDLPQYLGKNVLFIGEVTPNRRRLFKWIPSEVVKQIIYQIIKSIEMSWEVIKPKQSYDIILVFEHKPWYSIFLYLACLIKRKPTFFIIHDYQQTYKRSKLRTIGFKIFLFFEKRFKFYPIHLEKSDKSFRNTFKFYKSGIVMKIPIDMSAEKSYKSRKNSQLRIGTVGMLRPDKPIIPIINLFKNYTNDSVLVKTAIGTPFWQLPDEILKEPIEFIDTALPEQYNSFIQSLDICINYYEKNDFYYRSSGVINDAVSGGCFVIVPNYPVFNEQISNPVKVGETYEDIRDLEEILDKSIEYITNNDVYFDEWCQSRSIDTILKDLSKQILKVL